MSQDWLVGLIVVAAALYAVWHWLPARLRHRLLRRPASEPVASGGCGACSGCADGGCAPPPRSDWREVSPPGRAQDGSSGARP